MLKIWTKNLVDKAITQTVGFGINLGLIEF